MSELPEHLKDAAYVLERGTDLDELMKHAKFWLASELLATKQEVSTLERQLAEKETQYIEAMAMAVDFGQQLTTLRQSLQRAEGERDNARQAFADEVIALITTEQAAMCRLYSKHEYGINKVCNRLKLFVGDLLKNPPPAMGINPRETPMLELSLEQQLELARKMRPDEEWEILGGTPTCGDIIRGGWVERGQFSPDLTGTDEQRLQALDVILAAFKTSDAGIAVHKYGNSYDFVRYPKHHPDDSYHSGWQPDLLHAAALALLGDKT